MSQFWASETSRDLTRKLSFRLPRLASGMKELLRRLRALRRFCSRLPMLATIPLRRHCENIRLRRTGDDETHRRISELHRSAWYRDRYRWRQRKTSPDFFSSNGLFRDHNPNALFDALWYRKTYDIPLHQVCIVDYLTTGHLANREPSPYFNSTWYRSQVTNLPRAMSPLEHYWAEGRNQLLSPHPLFDPHWYVDQCIEFEDKTLYDLEHYVVFGSRIGRSPSPMFWPNLYRLLHREVKAREIEPLYHYLRWGGKRSLQGSPFLDPDFYTAQIPGVEGQVEFEPLSHFTDSGHAAHLSTSADERANNFAHWLVGRRDLIRNRVQTTDGARPPFCDWRERAKTICLNGDPAPRISVIIPTFNRSQDVVRCIESIARSGDDTAMEVILVDDGSLDAHQEIFRLIEGIRVVTLNENRGFAHAIENGVSVSSAEYVMFLNNDTEVMPNWVDALVEVLDNQGSVGAVGSLILHADMTVQEVGGLVWRDGTASHIGRGLSPLESCTRRARTVDYCSGASLAVRRQLWDTIGGFDPRFAPAYYEDTDLCFSIARQGFEVLVNPESVVVHKESASYGRDPTGRNERQEGNHPLFVDKWKEEFANRREHPRPEPHWQAWVDQIGE